MDLTCFCNGCLLKMVCFWLQVHTEFQPYKFEVRGSTKEAQDRDDRHHQLDQVEFPLQVRHCLLLVKVTATGLVNFSLVTQPKLTMTDVVDTF